LTSAGSSWSAALLVPHGDSGNGLVGHVLRMRFLSELVPVRFFYVDAVMLRRFLDVREGEFAVGFGHVLNLVEARQGVLHVRGVGQRLLALLRKGVDTLRQVAALRQ